MCCTCALDQTIASRLCQLESDECSSFASHLSDISLERLGTAGVHTCPCESACWLRVNQRCACIWLVISLDKPSRALKPLCNAPQVCRVTTCGRPNYVKHCAGKKHRHRAAAAAAAAAASDAVGAWLHEENMRVALPWDAGALLAGLQEQSGSYAEQV